MKVLDRFRPTDLEAIREAVAEAELSTSGEIVTYIVGESDDYPEAGWRGAGIGALAGLGCGVAAHAWSEVWASPVTWLVASTLFGFVVGWLLGTRVPPIRRGLVRSDLLTHRVSQRAETAFLEEEVFDTEERTGILIFVALFEHRVIVLGDRGINSAVEQDEWNGIVARMVEHLRRGEIAEGVLLGVGECGQLLEHRGVQIRPDDRNELSNEPRLRDR